MSARISILEHFKKLAHFVGREDRASFWPYAAVALIIIMVAGAIVFVPMMSRSLQAMQQFATQHPEQATISSGPGQYSISVAGAHPEFVSARSMLLSLVATFGVAIILYAAAVTRRLHDRGRSGLWGLMPLPFIIYSSARMPKIFASMGTGSQPDMAVFFSIFVSNLLYIVALIWLIVLLAGPSEPKPNRYGMV